MKAQRKNGRGRSRRACTSIVMAVLMVLGLAGAVRADTVWLSGHHEIGSGDVYGEIYIYNNVTVNILGGDIYKLEAFDISLTDWHAGEMDRLYVHDESGVNIFGGMLYTLEATQDSCVNIYAYDVAYDPLGGGYGNGWLEGRYWSDGSSFGFSLFSEDTYSHVIIVSEPVLEVEIDIIPNTLNLASKGKWISCDIKLPEGHNVVDVNSYTVLLQNEVPAEWIWFSERQNVVIAKFRRSEVQEILEPGEVELTVNGYLVDGSYFEGTDIIKVIDKGRRKD